MGYVAAGIFVPAGAWVDVGYSWYGGTYDPDPAWPGQDWVIQNDDQLERIRTGTLDPATRGARAGTGVSDDNGNSMLGPQHDRPSIAALTVSGVQGDGFGMNPRTQRGHLFEIQNPATGATAVVVWMDVGTGGGDVPGPTGAPIPRRVDLWWQTAQVLGITRGTGWVRMRAVTGDTPVTPILISDPGGDMPLTDTDVAKVVAALRPAVREEVAAAMGTEQVRQRLRAEAREGVRTMQTGADTRTGPRLDEALRAAALAATPEKVSAAVTAALAGLTITVPPGLTTEQVAAAVRAELDRTRLGSAS